MKTNRILASMLMIAIAGFAFAVAEPAKDKAPAAGAPEIKLPPGWTAEDMQACMAAMMPGKKHEILAKDAGVWQGKQTWWMYEGAEPMKSECVMTNTSIMDGRYLKGEVKGEMPGMGPFSGMGIVGFDNVSQKLVATWIDSYTTGIMNGTGELSEDGKTTTINYNYNCPVTKKTTVMRHLEKNIGPNQKVLEMYNTDPKSGKEYKMMVIEFTRKDETRAAK